MTPLPTSQAGRIMLPMLKLAYRANVPSAPAFRRAATAALSTPRHGTIGGSQATGGTASGRSAVEPIQPASQPDTPATKLPESVPRTPQAGASAPRTALKTAELPPVSIGAVLGVLFGQMLDREGHTGEARDAAIGAAAFASAEAELAERLHAAQHPPMLPTVFGAMPVIPAPMSRSRGQTL